MAQPRRTPILNPLSDDGIFTILSEVHPQFSIDSDSRDALRSILSPFEQGLGKVVNTERDINNFVRTNLVGAVADQAMRKYQKFGFVKSTIIEYLLEEILELAGNISRDIKGKFLISMHDIYIAIINDQELLASFYQYVPLFTHLQPGFRTYTIDRIEEVIPQYYHVDGTYDYWAGFINLLIAIVNHVEKYSTAGPKLVLTDEFIGSLIIPILSYSRVLQPSGDLTYKTLLYASLTNPNFTHIPAMPEIMFPQTSIIDIIAEQSISAQRVRNLRQGGIIR